MRHFGFYSNKARGLRAKAGSEPRHAVEVDDDHTPRRLARRRWAALIKRVWAVDPLVCLRCRSPMSIVSFIQPTQGDLIEKILTHCGLWQQPWRAPLPDHGRGPAPQPDLGQLRYESDLQFVDEPAPNEPAWIAD